MESRVIFFFQAEDGIRDADVTGVQTCALPICRVVFLHADPGQTGAMAADPSTRPRRRSVGDTANGRRDRRRYARMAAAPGTAKDPADNHFLFHDTATTE